MVCSPDFDVEITPQDVIAGRDPQLEKAVEVALAQIMKNPVNLPKRPAFPVHPGAGQYYGRPIITHAWFGVSRSAGESGCRCGHKR